MSFYDDLKKPYTPPPKEPPKPPISAENERNIAREIVESFKSACSTCREMGGHREMIFYTWITEHEYFYHFSTMDDNRGRFDWYCAVSHRDRMISSPFGWLICDKCSERDAKHLNSVSVTTYEECRRIYSLVKALLSEEGFPANTVTIAKKEIHDPGKLFHQTRGYLYCLLLDASW